MALAVNAIDKCAPSNKMHHQLQPKKTNGPLVINITAKGVYTLDY